MNPSHDDLSFIVCALVDSPDRQVTLCLILKYLKRQRALTSSAFEIVDVRVLEASLSFTSDDCSER